MRQRSYFADVLGGNTAYPLAVSLTMVSRTLRRFALAASLMVAATPLTAVAQSVLFSGAGTVVTPFAGLTSGAYSFSFLLPLSPTPSTFTGNTGFSLASSTGQFTQGAVTTSITGRLEFYTTLALGGAAFRSVDGDQVFISDGPQLFSGPTFAPTFIFGSGALQANYTYPTTRATSYEIAFSPATPPITSVPEPTTWTLLGTGLLALGFIRTRRKRSTL